MRGKFPTAALAVIQFDIDRWDQLAPVPADCARSSGPRIWHESVRARYPGDRTASAMMNLLAILGLGYAGVVVLLYLLQTSLIFPGTCRASAWTARARRSASSCPSAMAPLHGMWFTGARAMLTS